MRKFFSLIAAVLFAGSMMAETYTKTAFADLKSGDVVIITMQKATDVYAASNDKGTSNPPAAVAVTVAENAITTDATNILWTVAKDGANITFKAGDDALYCTNTNNGVRVGSNANNVFSIDAESGYLFNNATSRYIGVYNGADWRCYTTVNNNIKDQTLAFYAASGAPAGPVVEYYVVGSMNNWALDAAYKLAANPGQAGEYMKRFTFAANDELKVRKAIDGVLDAWYPEGMGNNWVINEAGQYDVYFRPEGNDAWANHYFYVAPYVIPQYEVAEAIAAGLTDGTEIKVRGVVSKMEIKGKNFANYGSACIYVSDATDQAGEFEFYNCLAIGSAKFTTTVPAYDATSTTWTQLTEVATADGYAIHVGDTVIAQGNYKLYNTTYELDQNCFIIYAKAPDAKYPTNIENAALEQKTIKRIENGKLVIIKNGVRYDALGTRL